MAMKVNGTPKFSDLDGWVNIFGNNVYLQVHSHSLSKLFTVAQVS